MIGAKCSCCGLSKKKCRCASFWTVKGGILIIIGLLLWKGFFSIEAAVAILLILGGLKFLLKPLCYGRK